MRKTIISHSEQETFDFGFFMGQNCKGGEVIILNGNLGAGKTVFTKGFAKALKIEDAITSPTFTIMNIYEGETLTLYHYDAYRLKSGKEAYEAGLTEYLYDECGVCVIEWAENIKSALIGGEIEITINYLNEKEREIIYEINE